MCTWSCPTLSDAMGYSPPGSSAHGIFQARILEWVAISSSRRSSQPRGWSRVSCISCIARQIASTMFDEKSLFILTVVPSMWSIIFSCYFTRLSLFSAAVSSHVSFLQPSFPSALWFVSKFSYFSAISKLPLSPSGKLFILVRLLNSKIPLGWFL